MSHWLHPAAERDLTGAADHYSEQASSRVAEAFLIQFERAIELLDQNQKLGKSPQAQI